MEEKKLPIGIFKYVYLPTKENKLRKYYEQIDRKYFEFNAGNYTYTINNKCFTKEELDRMDNELKTVIWTEQLGYTL
jgi:hypothetical protein